MTSDGISTEDWDRVHELTLEIVNAFDDDRKCRDDLFRYLDQLEETYGERPSLIAARADFVADRREAERLLLKAFDIAIGIGDSANICEIALSLADLYTNDVADVVSASRWLEVASAQLRDDVEADRIEFNDIADALERLKRST